MTCAPLPIAPAGEGFCLDFANTLAWRGNPAPTEKLSGFGDLLNWVGNSASVPPELLDRARVSDTARATALFAEAIALREAIYRIFAAAASGETIDDRDLAALNEALAAAPPRTRLVRRNGSYGWVAAPAGVAAPILLAPVLWSAADLLAQIDRVRVRRCANDRCLWLFIDHSKGGTRRWCDMASCGNRAKSHRHYLRTKPGAGGESA